MLDKLKKVITISDMKTFHVYLNGKKIDTVFYSENVNVDVDEVKNSLVNHDGYDPRIKVVQANSAWY